VVRQGSLVLAEKLTALKPTIGILCLTGLLAASLLLYSMQELRRQTARLTDRAAQVAAAEADYDLADASIKWLGYEFLHGPVGNTWFKPEAADHQSCGLKLGILSQDENGRWLLLQELPLPPELLNKHRNFYYLVQADYVVRPKATSRFWNPLTFKINCRAKARVSHPSGLIGAGPPVSLAQAASKTSLYKTGATD